MGNFNMLPEEIVLEIFSRLPTECVLECKLVSKPWKNVVKHPSFSQKHLNHLNDFDSGKLSFIFWDPQPYPYTEYDESLNRLKTTRINFIPPIENCCILGSCNGLICFFAWFKDHYSPAYICNPITREYVVLPEVEVRYMLTGFGYVPSTNEYKVVSICNNRKGGKWKFGNVQVYTLGSGIGWRNLGNVEIGIRYVSQPGEFVDGAIYWADKEEGTIHTFDLAVEEIRVIPSPRAGIPKLQAVGDFLCATYKYDGGCDIWVLKKDEKNQDVIWSKEFSHINLEPITLTKSGGLLCYDPRDRNVYRCAPKPSSSRMLVNGGKNFDCGVRHRNTFVSLKALGEEVMELMGSGERARSSRMIHCESHMNNQDSWKNLVTLCKQGDAVLRKTKDSWRNIIS